MPKLKLDSWLGGTSFDIGDWIVNRDRSVIGLFGFMIWALVWLQVPDAIDTIKQLFNSDREHIMKGGAKHGND